MGSESGSEDKTLDEHLMNYLPVLKGTIWAIVEAYSDDFRPLHKFSPQLSVSLVLAYRPSEPYLLRFLKKRTTISDVEDMFGYGHVHSLCSLARLPSQQC